MAVGPKGGGSGELEGVAASGGVIIASWQRVDPFPELPPNPLLPPVWTPGSQGNGALAPPPPVPRLQGSRATAPLGQCQAQKRATGLGLRGFPLGGTREGRAHTQKCSGLIHRNVHHHTHPLLAQYLGSFGVKFRPDYSFCLLPESGL